VTQEGDPVAEAAEAALAGRLIVLPTDTVYGIGTRPDDAAATARLFKAKGRARDVPLPVLAPSTTVAADVASFDDRAERLAARVWPGAVTIVVRRTARSEPWDLGDDRSTIGIRVPAHPLALAVLARSGPLAVTSANRSGEPTPAGCDELQRTFGDAVSVYLCAAEEPPAAPSTVVDLTASEPRILRRGALDAAELERLLSV
jgi:L-threonylcarbamoyladenylate synthase